MILNSEMEEMQKIGLEAREVAQAYCQKVPQPMEMMGMFRPMKFRKLRGAEHKIVRVPMERAEVSSFRHMVLFGVKAVTVDFGRKVTFHELLGPRGKSREAGETSPSSDLLTSDKPIEVFSQYIAFHKMHGHVLVGGLGLGMAAEMILRLPEVKSVTVVEINESLIKLIKPQIDPRIGIINADLFEYLKAGESYLKMRAKLFDSAYFDIWYGTGESTWQSTVVPLYRLARKAGISNLGAWGEHEMRGQLISALFTRTRMEEKYATWKPYKVFIEGAKKVFGDAPPWNGEYKDDVVALIRFYLEEVGTAKWEETFDWEAA